MVLAAFLSLTIPMLVEAQEARHLFPARELMPTLYAGLRDPVTKAELLYVTENPNAFDAGVEAEVAVGITLPVYLLAGETTQDALVLGVEAAAFARFTLQITERELIATDWKFAVPLVWHRGNHWLRLRYYHASSHLGDEYARRFEVEGENFSRDAIDLLGYLQPTGAIGAYAGIRYAYNVHPEDSRRWAARAGAQLGDIRRDGPLLPYGSIDVELDEDANWDPRLNLQAGVWLPTVAGRRAVRAGVGFLTGPTPLGQFQGLHTTQFVLGVYGNL